MPPDKHAPSEQVLERMREQFTFQLSVDTDNLPQGLAAADAAVSAGITIVEMGTPLIKFEGAIHVVPAFRRRFPEMLLLADLKTMDGGAGEAHVVFRGGANIVDFLALSGVDTARAICSVRDEFRRSHPEQPRLVFADILLPHQGSNAVGVAVQMLDAGVDGIGAHLQSDARTANPDLSQSGYLQEVILAVKEKVGDRAPVQAVGGLTIEQACRLAGAGIRAIVISANLGIASEKGGLALPQEEIEPRISRFIREVTAAGEAVSAP
ncbi:MAG TPA: orotidine 5'-phosphate decarboxylase / HUMPS family protein [Armatimonadota bacterium]|nr:orotidine 5'-phosphate decarboxylase / HUMPS family protein [Armatimonadota bacterium]